MKRIKPLHHSPLKLTAFIALFGLLFQAPFVSCVPKAPIIECLDCPCPTNSNLTCDPRTKKCIHIPTILGSACKPALCSACPCEGAEPELVCDEELDMCVPISGRPDGPMEQYCKDQPCRPCDCLPSNPNCNEAIGRCFNKTWTEIITTYCDGKKIQANPSGSSRSENDKTSEPTHESPDRDTVPQHD